MALMLPVLVIIVLGIVGFSQVYGEYQTLTSATAAAARFEEICNGATVGDASTIGQNAAPNIDPPPTFTFLEQNTTDSEPYDAGCGIASGTAITVTGSATSVLVNLYGLSISVPLSSAVTVVEQ
jgi:Flp pilus assembly protein TadG